MGLRVKGLGALGRRFEPMGKDAPEAALEEVRKGAQEIANLAEEYAPRDLGSLKSAVKFQKTKYGTKSYKVFIDESVMSAHGYPVGQYAYIVHEGLPNPAGFTDYGATGGADEGPFYLERAAQELDPVIREKVMKAMRRVIR